MTCVLAGEALRETRNVVDKINVDRKARAADPSTAERDDEGTGATSAEAFFRQRLERAAAEGEGSEGMVAWSSQERATAQKRRQRLHADAVLAAAAAEASSPLLTNSNRQVNVADTSKPAPLSNEDQDAPVCPQINLYLYL